MMEYQSYPLKNTISIQSLISVFDFQFERDYSYKGESHPFWEFVYVQSGSVGVTANDAVFILGAGQIIFHKPLEFHRIWSSENTSPRVVVLTFQCADKLMKSFENLITHLKEFETKMIFSIVEESQRLFEGYEITDHRFRLIEKTNPPIGSDQIIKNQLECLLLHILQDINSRQSANHNPSGSALLYNDVISFLENNIEHSISMDDICNHCHCSPSNLKKIFRKYVGTGVMKHFLKLKLKRGVVLLQQGHSVNEVASLLGFSSPYYFSSAFKREMGKPPSKYVEYEIL